MKFFKSVFWVIVAFALYGTARNSAVQLVGDVQSCGSGIVQVFTSDEVEPVTTDTDSGVVVMEADILPTPTK